MKKIFTSCLAFALLSLSFAQKTKEGVVDKAAIEIMNQIASKYTDLKSLSLDVNMKQTYKTELSEQKLQLLLSENKYRLSSKNQTIYCDGITQWILDKTTNEVMINKADSKEMQEINLINFTSNWKENFRAKLIREEKKADKVYYILDLTPLKKKSYHKIRISVEEKTSSIQSMQLHEYEGTVYIFDILFFTENPKFSLQDFQFDPSKYPSMEVIDMR